MNLADLIQELRDATRYCDDKAAVVSNLKKPRTDNDYGRMAALHERAADSLASKDTALAEIRADRDAICKMLVIANAQLADMEFLTVEGFLGWKQDRASRSISQDGEEPK